MRNNYCGKFRFCFWLLVLLVVGGRIVFAQESKLSSEVEIRALLNKSFEEDNKIKDEAREGLSKLDTRSIPVLKNILERGTFCEQVKSTQMIIELNNRDNKEILSQIVVLARQRPNKSLAYSNDWFCRRLAAFLLPYSAEGIRQLTKLLTSESLYLRQNAIFAFDDLTEARDYSKESLQAIKEAIPIIAKATNEKDEIVSAMSNEVLSQISNDPALAKLVEAAVKKENK